MLLDILLIIGTLEKSIGNSTHVTLSGYGGGGEHFPNGLMITAERIVERQVIKLGEVVPAMDLAQANHQKEMEEWILLHFVEKAKAGYMKKFQEMRTRIEKEIQDGTKA